MLHGVRLPFVGARSLRVRRAGFPAAWLRAFSSIALVGGGCVYYRLVNPDFEEE